MAWTNTEDVERQVLDIVREQGQSRPSDLLHIAESSNLSDVDVKRAIWRLIDKNLIYFSPQQRLIPVPEVTNNPMERAA